MSRHKLSRRASWRINKRSARRTKAANIVRRVGRGGIRF